MDSLTRNRSKRTQRENLCTWDAALYTDKVLKEENRDKLFKPELNFLFFPEDSHWPIDHMALNSLFREEGKQGYPEASYALGWSVHPNVPKAGTIHEHGGSIPGFNTYILRYPETKSCIVVLTNLIDLTRKADDEARDLSYRLEDLLLDIPKQ
jgi:hypothetical protein